MYANALRDLLRSDKDYDIRARSFEGDIYLLEIGLDDTTDYLASVNDAQPICFRSYWSVRDFVHSLGQSDIPVRLVHQSPYEEMIGLPR